MPDRSGHTSTSEIAKVTSVVHSATQRAVPRAERVVAAHQHDEQRADAAAGR